MEQSNKSNKMKPHQISALFFIVGLLSGALLHYVLFSGTVSYKVNEAYEQGINFGKEEECNDFIKQFNEADSVYIGSNEIKFYYK